MEKKLYYLLEDNYDLSVIVSRLSEAEIIIDSELDSLINDDKAERQYTITPVFMIEKEYSELPDQD